MNREEEYKGNRIAYSAFHNNLFRIGSWRCDAIVDKNIYTIYLPR